MRIGYTLSSEEQSAPTLVEMAARAEQSGYDFLGISDHFAPWTHTQGNSPFSWSVIGAISQVTQRAEVFVEVVCPIMRYHPAIVAQAAATSAALLEGRFTLGLGTGEWLNEHITGEHWPHIEQRREMLAEAINLIRRLWTGEYVTFEGKYFKAEAARIYSLPRHLPAIIVSGFGPKSIRFAAEMGDGLVSLAPSGESIDSFREHGGLGKPTYGQMHACFAESKERAREVAFKYWPNAGITGQLASELRLPAYFEQAAKMLNEETGTDGVILGPNVDDYVEAISKYQEAGYDNVYIHQIGPDQREFLDWSRRTLLPALVERGMMQSPVKDREFAFGEVLEEDDVERDIDL